MNSKYKVLASNTIIFAIGNVLVKLISFFLMPLYTSVLTTEQYGVAELLNNTIEIVLPLATLCIVEALYRFTIDEDANKDSLFVNAIVLVVLGDLLVSIGTAIWYFIFKYQYAFFFLLLYVTTTFYKLTTQFARGKGHVKRYAAYGVCNSLMLVAANIILLVCLNQGVSGYLMSFSIGYGVSGIIALIGSSEYKHIHIRDFNVSLLKEMLKYSLPSIPNMLSWWVNSLSDRYIVLFFWGAGVAGLYTAASKLPALINMVTAIFQQAWQYSTAVEIQEENNTVFFSNVFRFYMYSCSAVCAGVILFNKLICKILLQSDFYSAWKFVPLLLLAATFGCIATYFGTFYNAIKNNTMLMVSTLIGAITNIGINLLLIPRFGGFGAAIATAISYFVVMIIRMLNIQKYVNIDIDVRRFVIQSILLVLCTLVGCFEGIWIIVSTIILFVGCVLSDIDILKKIIMTLQKKMV